MNPDRSVVIQECGEEVCRPGHRYGPAIRPYYLIHFIRSGCGVFTAGKQSWNLGPGDGFIIFPGEVTVYQASEEDPWHYAWIGYEGPDAAELTLQAGLNLQRRVFHVSDIESTYQALKNAYADSRALRLGALGALGGLYRFLCLISQDAPPQATAAPEQSYCEKALWYMRGRLALNVRISEAADFVGLSRSQLFRAFQAEMGRSPKEMLQEMRLELARRLLTETRLPMGEIAASVGMQSPQQLCAAFKKHYGMPPGVLRKGK